VAGLALVRLGVAKTFKALFKVYLHSPTHISEFVPYGMNLSYNKKRIDPIFVCHAIQHLANMLSDCVNTP
jgi:hypothetical protein